MASAAVPMGSPPAYYMAQINPSTTPQVCRPLTASRPVRLRQFAMLLTSSRSGEETQEQSEDRIQKGGRHPTLHALHLRRLSRCCRHYHWSLRLISVSYRSRIWDARDILLSGTGFGMTNAQLCKHRRHEPRSDPDGPGDDTISA